ncbi:MAG: Gfo/Idh/MocA family oxidoreductase [Chloroflexi bacterium]|nr:Gfo/Idh/MocA family oxidoreductase [Chloroflexota bacterium]
MDDPVRLAIIGCGGMGRRHLLGLAELSHSPHMNCTLVAVCDPNRQNAEDLADEAHELLGERPAVFSNAEQMVKDVDGLEAADCPTDTGSHHVAATNALELGLNILCEKPLALTIRGCKRIIEAAQSSGRILSVAENYRRDPMNRLVRALIDDGAIGQRQFMIETDSGGRDGIIITPWRHMKLSGTIPLDAGVHNADILQYYIGDAHSAFGQVRLLEKTRVRRNTDGPGGFYAKWASGMPESIQPTGEDAIFGQITFANGALGHWVNNHAGHGESLHQRKVFGTRGSITSPGDRNGRPVELHIDDVGVITGARVLDYAPSYRLQPAAAALFGGERIWHYDFDFPTTDRKLLALEYHELATCIRTGQQPEVTGAVAMRDVALVYALFESDRARRPVTIEEVESSAVDAYQREIDEQIGLLAPAGAAL